MKPHTLFKFNSYIPVFFLSILMFSCSTKDPEYTLGTGFYPGNPEENFSPVFKRDTVTYRNLALMRPARHSGSYDYNLTAQLVTDGIISDKVPYYFSLTTNEGEVPKNEREWLLDHVTGSVKTIQGNTIWLVFEIGGDVWMPPISSIHINGELTYDENKSGGWDFRLFGSHDGLSWELLDQQRGSGLPGKEIHNPFAEMMKNLPKDSLGNSVNPFADFLGPSDPNEPQPSFTFEFSPPEPSRSLEQVFEFEPSTFSRYKVAFTTACAKTWEIGDLDFYLGEERVEMAPSHVFTSAWMSEGAGQEWISIDLGAAATFDVIRLYWIQKPESGVIQVSNDAEVWTDVAPLPGGNELTDQIVLGKGASGRYVRILMEGDATHRMVLSEVEIMGKGGVVPVPKASPAASGNQLTLAGGNWKIQRASRVKEEGPEIAQNGYDDSQWVIATVPATVLMSYKNAGAVPNPNYADNQLMISESFFHSDFWYRNEFTLPADFSDERFFLNFDGINWKADVFLNGKKAGRIEGAFMKGIFDVTDLIFPGATNSLAVCIRKNDHIGCVKEQTRLSPDKNGGILGADNPTFHASVGWDWIPTIRGRNIGIWNDVYLTTNGGVTMDDPFVTTDLPLPDTSSADICVEATLTNHLDRAVEGKITGTYGPIGFEEAVSLSPRGSKIIRLTPATHPQLRFEDPELWWPNGYGKPHLYEVHLAFESSQGDLLDEETFRSGVREMAFDETNNILSIYINGRRFIGRGGNWGFPESNLAYRGREYDIAVGYHADMNFTMIRNWVGQTGDEEFYEACDRHGIMVWQDFWLANPVDGPNPYDPDMFLANARNMIKRIRNHPSIAIYVGRNEGNPPPEIDQPLRQIVPELHPGIHYISNSSMGVVSGGGPYRALPPRDYYLLYGRDKLHSERGMPNVMTFESLALTLPENALWPQNSLYGLHDYCLEGAQGAASFNAMIEKGWGAPTHAREFTERAQWINYNGYRAMFEGRSQYRKGLILWMSHPAWPSMVWQTYDYYFEPTAAYFGCKKANEPLHIQWNPVWDDVEVVNLHACDQQELTAQAQIFNMDGSLLWEKDTTLDSREDTTTKIFKLEFPEGLSETHFIKLTLTKNQQLLSENFYWRGREEGNYQALNELPNVTLKCKTNLRKRGAEWLLETTLENNTRTPALMIRLMIVGEESKERILPALYSDNYISLLPGEMKTIQMTVKKEDSRGEKPKVIVSGFNLL
jgi:hypothetical protein